MEEFYKSRRDLLVKQIKSYDAYNVQAIQVKNQNMLTEEEIQHFQQPVIKELKPLASKLDLVKKVIEDQTEFIKQDDGIENQPETSAIKYKEESSTFELPDFIINDKIKGAETLVPTKGTEDYNGVKYNTININGKKFVLLNRNNKKYIGRKRDVLFGEFTQELFDLITGKGGEDENEIVKYYRILSEAGSLKYKKADYLKELEKIVPIDKETFKGEGISLKNGRKDMEYPIQLFTDLYKFISAKKAGHDNVDNDIKNILNKLLEQSSITKEKYKKIIKKYRLS